MNRVTVARFIIALTALPFLLVQTSQASDPILDLPVSSVTPGAMNASVTQANIQKTICMSGFTATIRPSSSYTTSLKTKQLKSGPYSRYGSTNVALFEEDHLIPLELGGNPTSSLNLWPEPWNDTFGAHIKDVLENKLHQLVCSGVIPLALAQKSIAGNWYNAYMTYVLNQVPTPEPSSSITATTSSPNPQPSSTSSAPSSFKMPFLTATNINLVVANWGSYGFTTPPNIQVSSPALVGDTCKPWQGATGISTQILKTDPPFGVLVNGSTSVNITLMCDENFTKVALPQPTITPSPSNMASSSQSSGASSAARPAGATGKCNDGTYSFAATHRGMCSGHGGVSAFYP